VGRDQEHGPAADEIASIRISTLAAWPEQIAALSNSSRAISDATR
jgi:hypothetical protein